VDITGAAPLDSPGDADLCPIDMAGLLDIPSLLSGPFAPDPKNTVPVTEAGPGGLCAAAVDSTLHLPKHASSVADGYSPVPFALTWPVNQGRVNFLLSAARSKAAGGQPNSKVETAARSDGCVELQGAAVVPGAVTKVSAHLASHMVTNSRVAESSSKLGTCLDGLGDTTEPSFFFCDAGAPHGGQLREGTADADLGVRLRHTLGEECAMLGAVGAFAANNQSGGLEAQQQLHQPPLPSQLSGAGPISTSVTTSDACMPLGADGEAANMAHTAVEAEINIWEQGYDLRLGGSGPPTLKVAMAGAGLRDEGMQRWCSWMDGRLQAAIASGGERRIPDGLAVRALFVDFSSNGIGATGLRALCKLLETHRIRCAVVKLRGNEVDDDAVKELARYLTMFDQAPILELHLSRNRISPHGVIWLLACLSMHPAYPMYDRARHAYVPLWLRLDQNAMTCENAAALISAALPPLHITVCDGREGQHCGTTRCTWMRATGDTKHNCTVHLNQFLLQRGPRVCFPSPPQPEAYTVPIFRCEQTSIPWPEDAEHPAVPPLLEATSRAEPSVLFEDADHAVLLKPAGWICTPTGLGLDAEAATASLPMAWRRGLVDDLRLQESPAPIAQYLQLRFGRTAAPLCCEPTCQFGLVHRLDLETSGPLLVAKTRRGYEVAKAQIHARDLVKDYVALVRGSLGTRRCGELRAPIDDSTYAAQAMVRVHPGGRDAITVYETIGEYAGRSGRSGEDADADAAAGGEEEVYSLLHVRLITGRTHQIRAHMAHMGHPVVADARYTGDAAALERDRGFCPRLFLHKVRIAFCTTAGQPVVIWCPLTMVPELGRALASLRPFSSSAAAVAATNGDGAAAYMR